MGERLDLEAAASGKREGLGAGWSRKKKTTVGAICAVVAVGALTAGAVAMIANMPPNMPKSAEEAVKVMGSDKFDKLSESRKSQYAAEAARLLESLSDEERRDLLRGRENRDAMRNMMMEVMDDNARRMARGEEAQWPDFGWGRGGGERDSERMEERRQRWEEMTDEEREQMRQERQERFNQMMRDQMMNGNSQDSALRGEFFQQMMSGGGFRGGGGPGGRRGGGGGGGGGQRGGGDA